MNSPGALLIGATNSVIIITIELYDDREPLNMPALFFCIIKIDINNFEVLFEVCCCLYFGHGLRFISIDVGFCSAALDEFR